MNFVNKKMPVRTLCIFLTFVTVLCSSCVFSVEASSEIITVMVETDSINAVCSKARCKLSYFEAEYTYTHLFSGFSAKIYSHEISTLSLIEGVDGVYKADAYRSLSSTDEKSEYNMVYADDNYSEISPAAGAGSIIAVLDNGFNLRHEMLIPNEYVEEKLDYRKLIDISGFTNAYKLRPYRNFAKYAYYNKKIPFAFDYAEKDTNVSTQLDHGTAMASVAAGRQANALVGSGTAPAAQILAMKVFDDKGRMTNTSVVVAALEDAYVLGADVVNMSLGAPAGFSDIASYDPILDRAIKKLTENGIFVVCSAGNTGSVGQGSMYDEYYSYDYKMAELPDSGTVSTPSTAKNVLSVANADVYSGRYPALRLGEEYIPYSDSNRNTFTFGERKNFNERYDGQAFEYVPIGGIGAEKDYEELVKIHGSKPLSGKLALIQRGETAFVEKINIAEKYGAEAVVIYDNTDEKNSLRTKMELDGTHIYAILVSKADGEKMLAADEKKISFNSKDIYVTNAGVLPEISQSSSTGPTPTLEIKPEIAAPGENINSATADGGYARMSGTSVSAAYVAGIAADIVGKFSEYDGIEKINRIKNILMSSAKPIKAVDELGKEKYVSVNLQGAGIINAENAKSAELLITHNGKSKAELGNNLQDKFELTLKLENISTDTLDAEIFAVMGANDYIEEKYSELCNEKDAFYKDKGEFLSEYLGKDQTQSAYFTGNLISPFENASIKLDGKEINAESSEFEGAQVSLKKGETLEVTLEFDISDREDISEIFKNGYFAEGFVIVKAEKEYSVPMLGFVGDFFAQSPFKNLYDGTSVLGGIYLYSHVKNNIYNGEIFIGTNNVENGQSAVARLDEKLCAVSPGENGGDIYLSVSLLRNVKNFKAEVYDKNGALVSETAEREVMYKAYESEAAGVPMKYNMWLWNCRSTENEKYIYPDGIYTCKLSGYDALGNCFTEEIDFLLDTQKPTLTEYKVIKDGDKRIFRFSASDNHYLQAVVVADENLHEISVGAKELSFENAVSDEEGKTHEFEVELTDFDGDYIYITVYDMAFNYCMVRVDGE